MIKRRFICKRCGNKFEAKVFEPREAEERKVLTQPVRCPDCGEPVERIS